MNDEKQNNDLDNLFREELENLPEETPSARDWEQMSKRIQSEGLLDRPNGRKYLLLILFALLATIVSLPFLMNDNTGAKKGEAKSSETIKKDVSTENKISEPIKNQTLPAEIAAAETTSADAAANSETPSKDKSSLHLKSESKISKIVFAGNNDTKTGVNNSKADGGNFEVNSSIAQKNVKSEADVNDAPRSAKTKNDIENKKPVMPGTEEESPAPVTVNAGGTDEKNASVSTTDTTHALAENQPQVDSNVTTSTAKDTTQPKSSSAPGRFRLGIYASLDYNYYSLKESKNVAQAEADYVSQSSLIEGDKWGGQYTIGIMGGYLFNQKLSLEAGVFYSQKKKLHATVNTPAYTSEGQEMFTDFTYDYKARYFELYGRFKYYLLQRKISWYGTLGAAGSFNLPLINSDYFTRVSYSESLTKTENVKLDASSVGAILIVSAGVEIPLGKKCDIFIEPVYRYSFSPVIKHPNYDRVPVEHLLRSISLATGLMFRF